MVIGITGKFCTGKNRVGSIMEKDGWDVIDVDHLGYEALHSSKDDLVRRFGEAILDDNGEIDRRILGEIVFKNPVQLAMLESVIHPIMVEMCEKLINDRDVERFPRGTVLNAAVLHKMGLDKFCSVIIYVKANILLRFFRAKSTRFMTVWEFIRRNRVQKVIAPKYFFDETPIYVIMNNHGDESIRRQLTAFYKSLKITKPGTGDVKHGE